MTVATAQVQKRDGRIVNFDRERITNAIFKAAQAVGQEDGRGEVERITDAVVAPWREISSATGQGSLGGGGSGLGGGGAH